MEILVVDVGGTNVKMLASGQEKRRKFVSGPKMTPEQMVDGVKRTTADWKWDRVTVGIPAPVKEGRVMVNPRNLGPGWKDFDFAAAFGVPTKVINDAAMQALGSYEGGTMLFLGLGTGLGSAMVSQGHVVPLELAHLPFREGTFEDYVGDRGFGKHGRRKWIEYVTEVCELLRLATVSDYVVVGGGNVKRLDELPPYARAGNNRFAFFGGFRLWEEGYSS